MHFRLLLVAGVITAAATAMAAAPATSTGQAFKEGCRGTCGNLSIPYPFGTNEGCYHDQDFLITCDTTQFSPPKAFLRDLEVTDISLHEGQLNILHYITQDCYNKFGTRENYFIPSFTLSKFKVSDTKNKFVAFGCDTNAYIKGYQGDRQYGSGCISICDNLSYVSNGSCSGIGCCQTPLPKGVDKFKITLSSYNNHTNVSTFNLCSYAFVVQENAFNFSSSYLGSFRDKRLPVVLDWAIGNETCAVANHSNTYACGNLSYCVDTDNGPGYRCSCLDGFQGNPYLPNGCQDIDECEDSSLNQCEKVCINTIGNYTCSCPKGYHGDGWKGGHGCIANQTKFIFIGIFLGVGLLPIIFTAWGLHKVLKKRINKKRKEKNFKQNGGLLLQHQLSSSNGGLQRTKVFSSKELEKATDNFNKDRILGQGGQGTVYKGMLSNGKLVAIKRSKIVDEGSVKQFINEVIILSHLNHRNVVSLLGCCLETDVPLLVYEFVPNGTLFQVIHDPHEEFQLSWEMRLQVAIEVAGALSYLHYAATASIYHRDIKSANILLDDKYRAKVSDFGTSRTLLGDQTHLTTVVQGTFGYLDPEYFRSNQFTDKSDVYSFGVVMVELLTGEKPISSNEPQEPRSLVQYFLQSLEENIILEILDPKIPKEFYKEEMEGVAHLAKRCLSMNGKDRPSMKEVLAELERISRSREKSTTRKQSYKTMETSRTNDSQAWNAASSTSTWSYSSNTTSL